MFNFTTTTVVNLDGQFLNLEAEGSTKENRLYIPLLIAKGVGNFKKENVSEISYSPARDAKLEKVELTTTNFSDFNPGDYGRIEIEIALTQASNDSRYANDTAYKGKQFSFDFMALENRWKTALYLVESINKYQLLVYGDKLLSITYIPGSSNGATGIIPIEATIEYQRIKSIKILKYTPGSDSYPYSGSYKTVWSLADHMDVKTAGVESFGTYDYLLHNLRLPTFENTRAFGTNGHEMPVLGAKYNQITIQLCADRGPLGLNAVGDTVKSVTTHVFFVQDGAITTNALTAIENAFGVTLSGNDIKPDTKKPNEAVAQPTSLED